MDLRVDSAELDGLKFQCIEGCAYCCLCPPEVTGRELLHFRAAHPATIEDADGSPHLALQGGAGGCALLRDRRCTDYGNRPFHCRAFPLRVHLLDRVQACANLSCRGIQREKGAPLSELLDSILKDEAAAGLEGAAAAAVREWGRFVDKAFRRGVPVELQGTRLMLSEMIPRWPADLDVAREEVIELVSETFSLAEPAELPVYVSPALEWQVFQADRGILKRLRLMENGELVPSGNWPLQAIPLLELTQEGRAEFAGYMQTLNRRDPMAGSAALVVRATGFEEEFEEAYLDILRDCALDLWWRSSLLAFLNNTSVLGAPEIREGIVFCDADFLDMVGIGGML
jgi:Fe-S-cluster containining protein